MPEASKPEEKKCPTCNVPLEVLLFMGVQPDGYVCPKCRTIYNRCDTKNSELRPLAKVY